MRKIRKILKGTIRSSWYMHYYYNSEIDEKMILLDSKNGKDLGGNILRIAQELSNNELYAEYDLYISCNKNKFKELKRTLATYKIDRAHIVKESGFKHFQLLAKSKFIFTDTSFPFEFVKKEGQIITNTWHGTPLKKMGRDIDGQAHTMSNVQKSFIISDYLLFPSDYMKNIMIKAYCLDNLYKGKILSSGYPRNSIFFYPEKGEELRNRLGFGKKHVYAYMPTWRGTVSSVQSDEQILQVKQYLDELDKKFNEDEVLLVRLHPFVSNSIELNNYHHIQPFPNGFEPYDILNMVDCLITDYSSVFFDFANSRKKIVLFVYDKDLYLDDRGIYVQMETFPFPQVYNVTDLLVAIRSEKEYDDSEFRDTYCKYDRADSAKIVCHQIILGKQILVEESVEHNGKDNVLMCGGPLAKNGLTTAFLNLLESIDNTKRNYFVLFVRNEIRRNPSRLNMLPEWASIMVMNGFSGKTPLEYAATFLYFKKDKMSKWIMKYVDRFFDRQYKSFLGECDFDYAIHYSGYGLQLINLFQNAQCKNIIFVHSDMIKEIETRHIQHEPTIRRAYNTFYRVVPVTTDIYIPTIKLGQNEKNIMIVNNCQAYKRVIERGNEEILFDNDTLCTISIEELRNVLNSSNRKFINIARFSPEKGQFMLLDAFELYYNNVNKNSYLIIIGGHGVLYNDILEYIEKLNSCAHIIVIRSILNPMPILKKCDLFILSSLYEGLGLVILEADTLGVPVISTDISGPRGFMLEHNGYLVPPNADSLYKGMIAYDRGEILPMNVDFEKYNEKAVEQFEELFK